MIPITVITISNEYSTDRILDWLLIGQFNCIRANTNSIYFPSISVSFTKEDLLLFKRKFALPVLKNGRVGIYMRKELKAFWLEFLENFKTHIVIGHYSTNEPSRIKILEMAKRVQLKTPDYLLTSKKLDLLDFLKEHQDLLVKPLSFPPNIVFDDIDIAFRAAQISSFDVLHLQNVFYPTFFQQMIPRDYEVRVFFLKGRCWAMAFVVKKVNETSPDIWNIKKRREVPIVIPRVVERKIVRFMKLAGYNTGSLDFIINGKDWYFLEVNPSGQYDFVSKSCNYFLDREIAKLLEYESRTRA